MIFATTRIGAGLPPPLVAGVAAASRAPEPSPGPAAAETLPERDAGVSVASLGSLPFEGRALAAAALTTLARNAAVEALAVVEAPLEAGLLLRRARRSALSFGVASAPPAPLAALLSPFEMPTVATPRFATSPFETGAGGGELLMRRRRKALTASVASTAASAFASAPAAFAAGAAGFVSKRAASSTPAFGAATLDAGELSLVPRAPTASGAGVLPVRFARLFPIEPTGIGMPLARVDGGGLEGAALAGNLGGNDVPLRVDWAAALGGGVRAGGGSRSGELPVRCTLSGTPLAGELALRLTAVGLAASRRGIVALPEDAAAGLSREAKSASSSESQSDGSGRPGS